MGVAHYILHLNRKYYISEQYILQVSDIKCLQTTLTPINVDNSNEKNNKMNPALRVRREHTYKFHLP